MRNRREYSNEDYDSNKMRLIEECKIFYCKTMLAVLDATSNQKLAQIKGTTVDSFLKREDIKNMLRDHDDGGNVQIRIPMENGEESITFPAGLIDAIMNEIRNNPTEKEFAISDDLKKNKPYYEAVAPKNTALNEIKIIQEKNPTDYDIKLSSFSNYLKSSKPFKNLEKTSPESGFIRELNGLLNDHAIPDDQKYALIKIKCAGATASVDQGSDFFWTKNAKKLKIENFKQYVGVCYESLHQNQNNNNEEENNDNNFRMGALTHQNT